MLAANLTEFGIRERELWGRLRAATHADNGGSRFVFRDDSAVIKERVEKIKQSADDSASDTTPRVRSDKVHEQSDAAPVIARWRHMNTVSTPLSNATRNGPDEEANWEPSPCSNTPPAVTPAQNLPDSVSHINEGNEGGAVTSNVGMVDNTTIVRHVFTPVTQRRTPDSSYVSAEFPLVQTGAAVPVVPDVPHHDDSSLSLSSTAIASVSVPHSSDIASNHPLSSTPNPYGQFQPVAWTPPLLNFAQILSDWRSAEIGYGLSPRISTQSLAETVELCDPSREPIIMRRWRTQLLPRMAPVLSRISPFIEKYDVVKYAVLALGAAHMNQSEIYGNNIQLESRQAYPEFYADGLAYYSQALESLGVHAREGEHAMEMTAQLTVVILCTYFEIGSGTFSGSYYHLQQIERAVIANHEAIMRSPLGVELVIAWAGLKAQHFTDCLPFRTNEPVAIFADEPLFRAELERSIALTYSDHAFIMLRLCTICRASDLLVLQLTVGHDSSSPLYRSWVSLMKQIGRWKTYSGLSERPVQLYEVMDRERALLDDWESSMSLSDRPIESFSSKDMMRTNVEPVGLRVRPLRFSSHRAAMNYLRYCCAQLYASRENIQYCCNVSLLSIDSATDDSLDPWVMLCLRVVAGLDVHTCLAENMYELGVVWVLTKVALRSCSIHVLDWIYDYLCETEISGGSREGRLPINLVKRVLRQLIEEWHRGRVVQLVYTALESFLEIQELCDIGAGKVGIRAVMLGRMQRTDDLEDTDMTDCEAFPFLDMVNVK
ncbi:hypothetical protein E8E14_013413 [Neopestalotiopsis sp. 37M]|nr:hypothetical protein E8E14_013413 [Neopestalotiopsis sp. 37M]